MIINLTPHPIDLRQVDGTYRHILPEGTAPRAQVASTDLEWSEDNQCYLCTTTFTEVSDLPPKQDGILLVVSRVVCEACPDRDDLVYPTALKRNAAGEIIGSDALSFVGRRQR